jgi:hypothetical protein
MGVFPKQQIKLACETILKIMTLGNAITVKKNNNNNAFNKSINQ